MLKSVNKVDVLDPYTVKFTLKEPFAWFLDMIANPMAVAIIARECVAKFGDLKKPEAVVGTGPLDARQLPIQRGLHAGPESPLLHPRPSPHRPDRGGGGQGQCLTDRLVPRSQVRPRLGVPRHHQPHGLGALPRLIPGDVVVLLLQEKAYARDLDELRAKLGLDRPLHVQYIEWLGRVLGGDLGESLWTRRPVAEELRRRLPVTLEPAFLAAGFAVLIAVPVGVLSAVQQDTLRDYAARSAAILGLSVPSFWLATLIIVLPAIWGGWRPMTGFVEFGESRLGHLVQFLLPALVLGVASGAALMRLVRGMLLEVLRQGYVRTAWAKGLREAVVVLKHSLKNAVIPVVTVLGIQLTTIILGGTVVIETIFGLPGVSRFLFDAINQRDYPVIQGVNLVIVSLIVLVNLAVDAIVPSSIPASGTSERLTVSGRLWYAARLVRGLAWFARKKPLGALGGVIVLGMLVLAIFAAWIAPYSYDETVRGARMTPPSGAHWLGTDNLSRDLGSRLVYGRECR